MTAMTVNKVLQSLCVFDPRNPNNSLDNYDEGEKPAARQDCACDNCFYGRDLLALEILRLRGEENKLEGVSP